MIEIKKVPKELSKNRLDKTSSILFDDFSRTQLKKWILDGRIRLNGEIAQPKDIVFEADEIEIDPISETRVDWQPEDILFDVIYECDDYLVINKRPGLIMHPGAGCKSGTLANGLLFRYPELTKIPRAGIVHRLDKDTSGVVVVAKNDKFRNYFVTQLQNRSVKKIYKAIVVGSMIGSFTIKDPIGRDKNNRTKMSVNQNGKEAETFVKLERGFSNYSLLNISILTGRTHQIRVHLSYNKLPIIGDKTYNPSGYIAKKTLPKLADFIRKFPRQALHASSLSFQDENTKKDVTFDVEMPKDMKRLVNELKKTL